MDNRNFRSDSDDNYSQSGGNSNSTETSSAKETTSFPNSNADISSSKKIHGIASGPVFEFLRNPVSKSDVINAMKWAELNSSEIAELIYHKIVSLSKNKTIIQIQIYGIGFLDGTKDKRGALQLSIALNLLNRFKESFPEVTVTCQEPQLVNPEKEYLQSKNIKILETEDFSSEHFTQVSTKIPNPAFICYMISGTFMMLEAFLEAHWNADILSRIIFVGNSPSIFYDSSNVMCLEYSEKLKQFSKICESKPLKFEPGSVGDVGIGFATCVYSISEENAKFLIKTFN